MILLDVSHTAHSPAKTGVQRVVRALATHLSDASPITFDPYARSWRPLVASEQQTLAGNGQSASGRGSKWPLLLKVRGFGARSGLLSNRPLPAAQAAVVPEIFSPAIARALPELRARVNGPIVALFHDAIALRLPELSPPGTVARFPSYLRELASFDGVAAVSEDSRRTLAEFWAWAGISNPPPLISLPLGIDTPTGPAAPLPTGEPVVLSVGTLEGRKNHLALLEACERLWKSGRRFRLELIGHVHRTTGAAAQARVETLAKEYPLRHYGVVDDATLEAAYRSCSFTVYPSLMEGFGLPVLESLARGRPCICGSGGALLESGLGGGCLTLPEPSADALTAAIDSLLQDRSTLERLAAEARGRVFTSWSVYSQRLAGWTLSLPRRSPE